MCGRCDDTPRARKQIRQAIEVHRAGERACHPFLILFLRCRVFPARCRDHGHGWLDAGLEIEALEHLVGGDRCACCALDANLCLYVNCRPICHMLASTSLKVYRIQPAEVTPLLAVHKFTDS